MSGEHRKSSVGIGYPEKRGRDGVNKGVRDKCCKHCCGERYRAYNGNEGNLQAEQDTSQRVRMDAREYPAHRTEQNPQ